MIRELIVQDSFSAKQRETFPSGFREILEYIPTHLSGLGWPNVGGKCHYSPWCGCWQSLQSANRATLLCWHWLTDYYPLSATANVWEMPMERGHGASCLTSLHSVDGWNYGWMWYLSVPCHKMRKITLFPNYQLSSAFPKHIYSIRKWNNSPWQGDKTLRKMESGVELPIPVHLLFSDF